MMLAYSITDVYNIGLYLFIYLIQFTINRIYWHTVALASSVELTCMISILTNINQPTNIFQTHQPLPLTLILASI